MKKWRMGADLDCFSAKPRAQFRWYLTDPMRKYGPRYPESTTLPVERFYSSLIGVDSTNLGAWVQNGSDRRLEYWADFCER
jgi:hypothetical protein